MSQAMEREGQTLETRTIDIGRLSSFPDITFDVVLRLGLSRDGNKNPFDLIR